MRLSSFTEGRYSGPWHKRTAPLNSAATSFRSRATTLEEITLDAHGIEYHGDDLGDRQDADDAMSDALSPNGAFNYSAHFTRMAVNMVPELDAESMLLFVLLARVARVTSYDFESTVHRPATLNYSSFFIVALLAVDGPMEGSRLASASGMSRAAVSSITKTLHRDGWVERSPSPRDGRSIVLSLSTEGRSRIPDLFRRLNAREQEWSRALSPDDRAHLVRLLRQLVGGAPPDMHSRA